VHVEPDACFLAAGFYHPEVKYLRPVRETIVDNPDGFERMLATMEERGLPVGPGGDMLTGMPRGFADHRDTPIADYLRWENYLIRRPLDDEALKQPAFTDEVLQMARASQPLLQYVWQAASDT